MNHETIKNLVAGSKLREAAQQLSEGLADSPKLQAAAIQLQERLTRLEQQELKAVVAPAEAALERNKVSDALLQLGAQLDLPPSQRVLPAGLAASAGDGDGIPAWQWVAGTVAVLLLIGFISYSLWQQNQPFDVRAYVHGPKGESQPITEGVVKMKIGAYMADGVFEGDPGQIMFRGIPAKYKEDSIRLFPVNLPQYQKGSQKGHTVEEQPIVMGLEPAATDWRGVVKFENGQPAKNAFVAVDTYKETMTDSLGRFRLIVPKPSGSEVQVQVRIDGEERFNKQRVISSEEPAQLILNTN